MTSEGMICREALDVADPLMTAAERLYKQTQHPDEAIPWGWITRSVKGRSSWRPGTWGKHLVLASLADREQSSDLAGFAYGAHLPGYGGYICYVGVDERYRRQGVGKKLFEKMFCLFADDARASQESLPFVIWESHRPRESAPEADWKLWEARIRLFDSVGGYWLEGIELPTPNFADPAGPPVPLQLFLRSMDQSASEFDGTSLIRVAAGLLENVYKVCPGDPQYDQAIARARCPRLRPAREAGRRKEPERKLQPVSI